MNIDKLISTSNFTSNSKPTLPSNSPATYSQEIPKKRRHRDVSSPSPVNKKVDSIIESAAEKLDDHFQVMNALQKEIADEISETKNEIKKIMVELEDESLPPIAIEKLGVQLTALQNHLAQLREERDDFLQQLSVDRAEFGEAGSELVQQLQKLMLSENPDTRTSKKLKKNS